jgi:hypothetical protein
MKGGTTREIPPSTPQIVVAAIQANARSIGGCKRAAVVVRVLPGVKTPSNPLQKRKLTENIFINNRHGCDVNPHNRLFSDKWHR